MKKLTLVCMAILLLFAVGCSSTDRGAETELDSVETIYHPEIRAQSNARQGSFVELESGCYYQSGKWIYFIPRGEDRSYPLCSKPNCTHEDSDCNAYCGLAFGYYDSFLYSVVMNADTDFKYSLVRINLDGTEHETVWKPDISAGSMAEFIFHDGKIYISIWGGIPRYWRKHVIGL